MGDLIYRQNAIDAICSVCGNDCDKSEFVYNAPQDEQVIMCPEHYVLSTLPSAETERLTDDDFETIRIHLNALKERLCNQRRWKEAEDYERLINRFIFFASAKPEIIHCKNCKHRESNDCPMYYEEWIEIDEGDGYFDTDNIIHDWTTDEGFCHCAELRGKEE